MKRLPVELWMRPHGVDTERLIARFESPVLAWTAEEAIRNFYRERGGSIPVTWMTLPRGAATA